jgi:hypothetical protein
VRKVFEEGDKKREKLMESGLNEILMEAWRDTL